MGLNNILFHKSKAGKKHEAEKNPLGLPTGGGGFGGKMVPNSFASAPGMGITGETPTEDQTLQNNGGGLSAHDEEQTYSPDVIREVHGHTTKINKEKQEKHVVGSHYYHDGKSILQLTIDEAQKLLNQFAGTGQFLNPEFTKERIDFGRIIGIHVDPDTNTHNPTTVGLIHYSKNGAHIVPAEPRSID